jgi:hypothetical protein
MEDGRYPLQGVPAHLLAARGSGSQASGLCEHLHARGMVASGEAMVQ